jgi:nucleotide-binding universal stress UspA family protein
MTGGISSATLGVPSHVAMKRFQNILVVTQPGFEELLDRWTVLIARNAATRSICLMHFDERPDPLLTRALGEAERSAPAGPPVFPGLRDLPGLELHSVEVDPTDHRSLLKELERGDYDLVIAPTGPTGSRARATFLCRKAPCPVLLLPATSSQEIHKIVVAVDFSEFSHDAIEIAATFARTCRLDELDLVHSWNQPSGYGWKLPDDVLEAQIWETARAQMEEMAAKHDRQGLPWQIHVRRSPLPFLSILETATEINADLTVVCSRGKSALSEAILGSTATEVVNHTHTACLVVKRKGAGAGLLRELLGLARTGEPV